MALIAQFAKSFLSYWIPKQAVSILEVRHDDWAGDVHCETRDIHFHRPDTLIFMRCSIDFWIDERCRNQKGIKEGTSCMVMYSTWPHPPLFRTFISQKRNKKHNENFKPSFLGCIWLPEEKKKFLSLLYFSFTIIHKYGFKLFKVI